MEGAVGISPDSLVKVLSCTERQTLILDCRPFMAYNNGHIVGAINVHCPPILKRRSGGFVALENIVPCAERREKLVSGQYARVVAYDQCTSELAFAATDSILYSVVKSLPQQVDLQQVFYVVGGYDALCDECPLLCATKKFSPLSGARPQEDQSHVDDGEPVEILPYLYLGNVHHSACRQLLQRLGVTALLNVSTSCPNHFPSLFQYLTIPVNDSASEDLATWFSTANDFIDSVQQKGGKVLVHCHAGRSRSATVCLAYLMRTCHLSLDAAYEHVRTRREVIDPNLNFMQQLQDYGRRIDRGEVPRTPTAVPLTPRASCGGAPKPPYPSPLSPSPATTADVSSMGLPALLLSAEGASGGELQDISDPDMLPPSAIPSDIQCFFSFSDPDLMIPRSVALTPLPLPS